MSTEQNKKIVQRLFNEGIGEKKTKVIDELVSDKFINHGIPNAKTGPSGFKEVIQQFFDGFPDMKINIQEIVGDGDTVATRGYFTGTHNGNFMGMGATGKKVKIEYIDFWKLSNGRCTENWVQMDMASMMQQLGATQHAL